MQSTAIVLPGRVALLAREGGKTLENVSFYRLR